MKAKFVFENIERLRNIDASNPAFNIINSDIFGDLLDVGTKKALGYLPLGTIQKYGDKKAERDLIEWAKEQGLKYKKILGGSTAIGALYIWDEQMLMGILKKYKDVLKKAGVPTDDTEDYVDFIEHILVHEPEYPEAYKVIGKTFNDKRFR